MTDTLFPYEGTPGTAITNANRAVINATLINLTGTTTGVISLETAAAGRGATGLRVTSPTGAYVIARHVAAAPNTKMGFAFLFRYHGATAGSALSGTGQIWHLMNGSGIFPLNLRFNTTNQPAWVDRANTSTPLLAGQTLPSLVPDTWYFAQGFVDQAAGAITAEIWGTTGTAPNLAIGTRVCAWVKASGADLGAEAITGDDIGNISSLASTIDFDDHRLIDGATALPGFYVPAANQAPTAAYDSVRSAVAAGASFTATLTGTDPDGTITAYEHSIAYASTTGATLSNTAVATATGLAPTTAGNVVVLQGRVKDNSGAFSGYVTKEICVPTSAPTVYPLPATTGGFNRFGTQTSDGDALASSADTDYLESPAALSGTVQTLRVRTRPMLTRSGTLAVVVRARRTGTSGHMTCRLMEGTTSRGLLDTVTVTDTWANYELDLTANQVDAISDWLNIFVEIDWTL